MNQQFKKGVIEICVLHYILNEDRYGYEIVKNIGSIFNVNENTVYPILKRLSTENYLETYLKESPSGPARKYYKLTSDGKIAYEVKKSEWFDFSKKIKDYLNDK